MPDVFSRDLNQDAVDQIDASAANPGLSPNEYPHREFEEGPNPAGERLVTGEDWLRSANVFADLADPSVMEAAWR
jgi:hypothetical protein